MDEEREVRGRKRLLVFDGGMRLFGLLVERLVAREWPDAQVRVVAEPRVSAVITVDELESGRRLEVCVTPPTRRQISDALGGDGRSMVMFYGSAEELAAGLTGLAGSPDYVSPGLASRLKNTSDFSALTTRESEVASLIAEGLRPVR